MRKRIPAKIVVGQLVGSTNPVQLSCIRVLHIEHHYNYTNYNRIKRLVNHNNDNYEISK